MGRVLTLRECADNATRRLLAVYPAREARWMVRIIFEQIKGWSQTDMAIRSDQEISDYIAGKVIDVVDRLLRHEPIQYIFGETRFYGLTLKVSPDVLIPRPETEELVDLIVADSSGRSDLAVMDLCTGSGCIAVALARNLPFSSVTAVDISEKALAVAKENAALTKTKIEFIKADVLDIKTTDGPEFDIIISNPPYIAESEKADMNPNVLDHEPPLALFVPDSDPLKFYRAISMYAQKTLKPGGHLYFEINPLYSSELVTMLKNNEWDNIDLLPDMQKKMRFIRAVRTSD